MTDKHESTHENPTVNPMAMTVEDAARILSAVSGERITGDMLRADTQAGAPVTADGRINLVYYAAWLVGQATRAPGGEGKRSET